MRDARQMVTKSEIRMDRIQLVWLTLGTVVALALMFGLGTVVGRRSALLEQQPLADPVAQADADGRIHQELTFYETLTAPQAASTSPAAPAAQAAPGPEGVAKPAPKESAPAPVAAATTPDEQEIRRAINAGPPMRGEYTVQVSAYQSRGEAEAYASTLERKGFRAFIVAAELSGKGTWYRVRLGRFTDESAANEAKRVLAQADIPAWVLKAD